MVAIVGRRHTTYLTTDSILPVLRNILLANLEWLSKMLRDMKHHVASL